MSVTIFVEGGGDAESTLRSCRQGFVTYCSKIAPPNRRPRIVTCGGRDQAFDKFQRAIGQSKPGDICVMLVDSEAPVTAASPVQHLRHRDGWIFPNDIDRHRVFLMVQAMEAWFLADREALAEYYNGGFRPDRLPGRADNVEAVSKDDLEPRLKQATRDTKTKHEYHKTRHAFVLLEQIDPSKVETSSPHAKAFHDFLRSL